MATEASELRRGNAIRLNGELLIVVETNHVKPGKGPAYLQSKLRNASTGAIRDYRFVARAWRNADEPLQVYVREADEALARLGGN